MLRHHELTTALAYTVTRGLRLGLCTGLALRKNETQRPDAFEELFLIFPFLQVFYRHED